MWQKTEKNIDLEGIPINFKTGKPDIFQLTKAIKFNNCSDVDEIKKINN